MNAYDAWLTTTPDERDAAYLLDMAYADVVTLAETSDGDAQEILAVAVEYFNDATLANIVRNVLAGKSVDAEMKSLVAFGVLRVAEFNLARKT